MGDLPKIVTKSKKRLGRGYGSGKGGHTVGRGVKGQKARHDMPILFEGLKTKKSYFKRMPLKRGRGKFNASHGRVIVNLSYLNILKENVVIDIDLLIKEKIVDEKEAKKFGVKILGEGEIVKKLTIKLPISKSAAKKVIAAGGKVVE